MLSEKTEPGAGVARLEADSARARRAKSPAEQVAEYLEALAASAYPVYSSDDHALWREVLARSERVVSDHAARIHPGYLEGLRALELPARVPLPEELNARLFGTGWRVVPVDGYLPATTYAALMASSIFPVSSRLRRREHIDFAPEPDMVHDIIGHLPMLFCAEHRHYLRELARYATRARPNEHDAAYHDAVRHAAELKGTPGADASALSFAERDLNRIYGELASDASEVTCLRRIYIWSIEFGLFGTPDDFTVHGAALMSAPRELSRVLSGVARREPYSLGVIQHENAFSDLLERYFVAKDYDELHDVLDVYAISMRQSSMPGVSELRELRPTSLDTVRRNDA